MSKFIKAKEGPKRTVIYTDEENREFEYSGGDLNWRTNNPGNLHTGDVARRNVTKVAKYKKGTITGYYIEGFGWLSKGEAIALAQQGQIDAVVAVSRSGNSYLRARPDTVVENNLEVMG